MRNVVALFSEVASAISVSRSGEFCASTRRIAHTFCIALNLSGWPTTASGGFFLEGRIQASWPLGGSCPNRTCLIAVISVPPDPRESVPATE